MGINYQTQIIEVDDNHKMSVSFNNSPPLMIRTQFCTRKAASGFDQTVLVIYSPDEYVHYYNRVLQKPIFRLTWQRSELNK